MTTPPRILALIVASTLSGLLGAHAADTAQNASWLTKGDSIPAATLHDAKGEAVDLQTLLSEQPTVLIFYRGGWCPYCNRHLSALVDIEDDLQAAGVRLLAISPDRPAKLHDAPERKKEPTYTLLSDQDARLIDAMGIGFEVNADTLKSYRNYGIDLEAASGRSHHRLPHPAVYVVGTDGVIQFAHVNPTYQERLEPERILAIGRKVAAMEKPQAQGS